MLSLVETKHMFYFVLRYDEIVHAAVPHGSKYRYISCNHAHDTTWQYRYDTTIRADENIMRVMLKFSDARIQEI